MDREAKHTPGPWRIDSMKAGSWHISDHNEWAICSRLSTVSHTEQESYANARLISAAPELLAALKDAANRLRGAGMLSDNDEIVAAVAKAESSL